MSTINKTMFRKTLKIFIIVKSNKFICFFKILIEKIDDKSLGNAGNYKHLVIQEKDIICRKLFEDSIHDEPAPNFQKEPLEYLPESLLPYFTYENKVLVTRYFLKNSFPPNRKSGSRLTLYFKNRT